MNSNSDGNTPMSVVCATRRRALPIATIALSTLLLAGCGGIDDVEVNLPFVGNVMGKSKPLEQKMTARNGLVLPPKVGELPPPETANGDSRVESWPNDPDLQRKKAASVAAAEQREYERDGDWKGERNSGNGLDDFNKKTHWSERQTGIFKKLLKKNEDDSAGTAE